MAIARHVIELMLNPFFICLLLLIICSVYAWCRTTKPLLAWLLSAITLLLVISSTGWIPQYLTQSLESTYPIIKQPDQSVHWVVVLGGGQNNITGLPVNDRLAAASIKRLIEGIRLLRGLPAAQLLLSGGASKGEYAEALLLKELALLLGVSESRIVLEHRSLNTADQAQELASLLHQQPFYLVTSAIHMPRSVFLCQQQLLHPIAAPTDFTFFWQTESWAKMIVPNSYNLQYLSIAIHELLGRAWAALAV